MEKKVQDKLNELLNTPQGAALAGKRGEIEKLANSEDGRKVREMLEGRTDGLSKALESSDTAQLESTLRSILSTDEGSRLVSRLSELLK